MKSIKLTDETKEKIDKIAKKTDRNYLNVMKIAVEQYYCTIFDTPKKK